MQKFHGDLLIGGLAIRHLEGTLVERSSSQQREWSGQFQLESSQEEVLEIGRQYLLMLDDGDSIKLVVSDIEETTDPGRLDVQFESTS